MGDHALPALQGPVLTSLHKLTVEDFHRMGDAGILGEGDRVELIEGALFDMAPIGSRHACIVDILAEHFTLAAQGRALVRTQGPLEIPEHNEPLPDVLLLKPRPDRYRNGLPRPADVLLVVEVADSSVARHRDMKIPIYGKHGIPEAWLVDAQRRSVTVYRQPSAEGYTVANELTDGRLVPAALPDMPALELNVLFG